MILLKEYESLEDVLQHIKVQVNDSIEFAGEFCPTFSDPESLFYWLHDRVKYVSDPTTIELIMTMKTMMSGDRTGIRGGGDCDDFTITGLACLISQGFDINNIVLVGNNRRTPVHIFCETFHEGDWYSFDLTNAEYNFERPYKYRQSLPFGV